MYWFEGSIPDAIHMAKQRSCVFVVVIIGRDEQSTQLISSWEDDRVSEEVQNSCVAIKVDAKSETCGQFSQIYPVVCIPSSFFIGENGIPLEVIAGSVSAKELMKRINRVKQMHARQIGGGAEVQDACAAVRTDPCENTATEPTPASAPVSAPVLANRSVAASTEPVPVRETGKVKSLTNTEDDGSLTATVTIAENASSDHCAQDSQTEENLDAKVERLAKTLEKRHEQRKIREEESQIKREIERRTLGKEMQDFRRKQEEEKTKRLMEERNREKAEEKAARERVKQQIALDRADRAARYAKTKEEEKAARQALLHTRHAEQEVRKEALVRERNTIVRIQFRLPDGSSFTNQFPSQSRLLEARQFAVQEVGNRYGNFTLATMFPRREFISEDLQKTLLELELAPSASIVLLPQSSRTGNTVVQSSGGGIWAILGTLLYPVLAVWRFLSSYLFATPPLPVVASRDPTHQSTSASDNTKRETLSKHTGRPKDFKKDGKVCRLRTQEDSEDDNNTWNGNSTQQM